MNCGHRASRDIRIIIIAAFTIFLACCGRHMAAPPPPPPPPPPPAPAVTLTAEPSAVEKGQSTTLSWTSQNATDLDLQPGVGKVQTSGSTSVTPQDSTTYALTATGPGGAVTATTRVTVKVPPPPPPPPPPVEESDETFRRDVRDVFFDSRSAKVRDDAMETLTRDADLLKAHPEIELAVEGLTDAHELPSEEAALGLGDRRATAVKDFLVNLGVSPDRISTISYGEDRPFCTHPTPACMQQNRRVHFSYGGETRPEPLIETRSYLVGTLREDKGFGLYSYILLPRYPTADLRRKVYLSTVKAYISQILPVEVYEPKKGISTPAAPSSHVEPLSANSVPLSELNNFYLPVKAAIESCDVGAPTPTYVICVFSNYNYLRAHNLLKELEALDPSKRHLGDGPYIVHCLQPIDNLHLGSTRCAQEDMSSLRYPDDAAVLLRRYMDETSRREGWNQSALKNFIAWANVHLDNLQTPVQYLTKVVSMLGE